MAFYHEISEKDNEKENTQVEVLEQTSCAVVVSIAGLATNL